MTLLVSIIFSVFTALNFFIKGQFFAGSGTTDLLNYFSSVPYICIIIIPALCFRKADDIYEDFLPFSRFKKLLINYTNILIKYSLMILFMIPVSLLVNLFGQIDYGQLFTSILCLITYGAALISFCLFINQLFTNNVLSLVISAIFCGIFNSIHIIPLYINMNNFIASVFKSVSFAWHFDAASKGIIDTRDILGFLLISLLFIYLSFIVKELKAGKVFIKKEKVFHSGIFFVMLLLLMNSSRYYTRIDFSKNKTYSVSKYTKELIQNLDENLHITYYRSSSLSKLYPQIRDVSDFLNTYSSQNKNITYTVKDPDRNAETKSLLENYGVTSQQLRTVSTNSTEYVNVYSAITIEYKGNIELIPFLMSSQTLEFDLDTRIKKLITGKQLLVNIVVGNGMSLSYDYDFIIPWLNLQGIVVNALYIEDPSFADNLAACTGPLLVIGDSEINIENAIAIENYIINQNQPVFFTVSPYSAAIADDWSITQNQRTNIVEILENWGVGFSNKITADISCARITMSSEDETADPYTQNNTITEILNYPLWISLLPQENCKLGMTTFWPVSLDLYQNAVPYLVTSPSAYFYEAKKNNSNSLIETNPFLLQQDSISQHEKGTHVIGAQITGPLSGLFTYGECKDSNIIVISDQYFLNTLMTGYIGGDFGDYRNFEFLSNVIFRLSGEEELAYLQSKTTRDTSLFKITDINQFLIYQLLVFIVVLFIIPLAFVMIQVIQVMLKKKQNKKIYAFIKGDK